MPACLPVAAIVLAAGAAMRMGRLKQTLLYREKPLVVHAVQQALATPFHPVITVVGAESESVRSTLAAYDTLLVDNPHWQSGMGTSIAAGVRRLLEEETDSAAVAILLADQPLVAADHLKKMAHLMHLSNAGAIAAEYNGTVGVPALFKRQLFGLLADLPPEAGARRLLRQSGVEVLPFPLPEAGMDIDTPEDYARLLR